MATPTFVISCFEASGDAIGAGILRALKQEFGQNIRLVGIAGPLMQREGAESWVDFTSLSTFGFIDVLRSAPRFFRLIADVASRIDALRPDALICIDAPDFHIRLVEKLRSHDFPRTQFVSPSVWAWRPERAERFARAFDSIFCILPIEPRYYQDLPVRALYVGHPSLSLAKSETITEEQFRAKFADHPTIALLPGSREGEIHRLKADFQRIKHLLSQKLAQPATWVIATLPHLEPFLAREFSSSVHIETDPHWRYAIMRYSDVALCCLGTVEFELSVRECPHVGVYRLSRFDEFFKKLLFRFTVDHGSLSNILTGREMIPEFLQNDIDHDHIAHVLWQLLQKDSPQRARQIADMRELLSFVQSPHGDYATLVAKHLRELKSAHVVSGKTGS